MPSVMDLFAVFHGDDKQLQVDAKKAGEAAGAAAGLASTRTLGQEFKKGLPGVLSSFTTGIAQGMGQQAWRGISGAIRDVVTAVPDLIERGKQYGLLVDDIADKTGATAERSSTLAATLMELGISTDGLGTNLRTLSREITSNEAEFRKLGIATRDANYLQLDTITILGNVRSYLSGTADGADKLALASKLLGKSAGDLIDYLNLTDEQAAALEARLRSLGLIVGEDFRAESEKALRASKELDLAFLGLGVTLQAELGPTIRAVISGATQFIVDHAADIRAAIGTITAAIAGLIAGLTGIDMGTSFIDQLASLGGEPLTATDRLTTQLTDLNTKRAELIANAPKVKAGTDAETAALDRQTAAVEKQLAALDRREASAEKAYQREIVRLTGVLQAELDLLDARDRAAAAARAEQDAAVAVAEARERLRQETAKAATGEYDTKAVADAQMALASAEAAQAEQRRRAAEDERRRQLEATKAYIENLADLEANAENRKALATTLAKRQTSLEASLAAAKERGDTEQVALITAKLEAVKTTEVRNQAAIRNGDRRTELEKAKADLADMRKAITSAIGGGSTEAQRKFHEELGKIDADIANTRAALQSLYNAGVMSRTLMGAGGGSKPPLGSGGGLSDAWAQTAADWKTNGETIVTSIASIVDWLGKVPGAIDAIRQEIEDSQLAKWFSDLATGIRYFTDPEYRDWVNAQNSKGAGGSGGGFDLPPLTKATGGFVPPGRSAWVGEVAMERAWSLPGGGTYIQPLAASAGRAGSPVIVQFVTPDMRVIAEGVNEHLSYIPDS